MHTDDQHLFMIRLIEYPDPPSLGKLACRAPQEVTFLFFSTRLLEALDIAAFKIDSGHNMPNRSVFASRIDRLKDQEQRIAIRGMVQLL